MSTLTGTLTNMVIFEILLLLMALFVLGYLVQSARKIGSKLSEVQSAQKEGAQRFEMLMAKEEESVKRNSNLQFLALIAERKHDWHFIVSLTSHQKRFESLAAVIQSLSYQILQPQKILLHLSADERLQLPSAVKSLEKKSVVTIVECDDLGPAKKLIPVLHNQKLPVIVIDDDLTFDPELFLHLMISHYLYPKEIIASRVHKVTTDSQGGINSFSLWQKQYTLEDGPSVHLVPTSGAGTLYPVGALHGDATNSEMYRELSSNTDDLWWYFQARRAGTLTKRIAGFQELNFIPGSQEDGLWRNGNQERNEINLSALLQKYGNPTIL